MPDWLLGVGFMVFGQVLGAFALTYGEVSLVEPLTATNLIFAMALSRWLTRQPLGWSGWGGVALLALGVTAFIVAGQPRGGGAGGGRAAALAGLRHRRRARTGAHLPCQTAPARRPRPRCWHSRPGCSTASRTP